MFNWNPSLRGQGFPMQGPPQVQMVGFGAAGQMGFNPAAVQFQQTQQWQQQQHQQQQHMGMVPMMGQQQQPQQWQAQHFHIMNQQQQPGMFHPPPQGIRMGMMVGGMNPVPPSHPPPEERPPLPSEPPPPLPHEVKPPLPSEQPKPPLPGEKKPPLPDEQPRPPLPGEKTSPHDGPRPPDGPAPPKPAPPPKPQLPDPALLAELEKVHKEEQVFLEQYKQWKQQYDDWREQNQKHPNKEQYEQYLSQWKTYEGQMESRKKSIAEQKASLEDKLAEQSPVSDPDPEERTGMKPWSSRPGALSEAGPPSHSRFSAERSTAPFRGVGEGVRDDPPVSEKQKPKVEGDDMSEEDMNLDDEEESGGGGIIESRSPPGPGSAWSRGPMGAPEMSQRPQDNWKDERENKAWSSQHGSGKDYDEEPKFPETPQGWNSQPHGPGSSGFPGGFQGGRGRGDWAAGASNARGMMGQGPRMGWRGRGAPPGFQGPPRMGGFQEHGDTDGYEEPSTDYQDEDRDRRLGEEYADPDVGVYGEEGDQSWGRDKGSGRGRDFPDFPIRGGRGAPGGFQRGRGGELGGRGRGIDFQSEERDDFDDFSTERDKEFPMGREGSYGREEGLAYGRGRGQNGHRGRGVRYGEMSDESDYYNPPTTGVGRGGWPMRGRGRGGSFDHQADQFANSQRDSDADYGRQGDDFDEVELQAQQQYAEDEETHETEDNFGFRGRGRGSMARGRGRGAFGSSYREEEASQEADSQFDDQDYYGSEGLGISDGGPRMFRGRGRADWGHGGMGANRGRGEMDMAGRGRGEMFRGRGGMDMAGRGRGGMDMTGRGGMDMAGRGEMDMAERGREEMFRGRGGMDMAERGRGEMFRGRGGMDMAERGRGEMLRGRGGMDMAGRGRGEMLRGRGGMGEINYASRGGMGRGFERGRGAYRGRGGFVSDYSDREAEYNESAGYGFGDGVEEDQIEAENYPSQHLPSSHQGRGGAASASGFGRGTYGTGDVDQYGDTAGESTWERDQDQFETGARGRGRGQMVGMGRGRGTALPGGTESGWNQRGDFGEQGSGAAESSQFESVTDSKDKGFSNQAETVDEPLVKRGRFDTDDRDPYHPYDRLPPPLPRDRFDPFGDNYGDPYDRYGDPYLRDPYFDPYAPLPYDRYGRYEKPLPERKPFVPAESIDYGHGEKKKAALQPKEVIDYGHGATAEPKDDAASMLNTQQSSLDDRQRFEDIRGRSRERGWAPGQENMDRQKDDRLSPDRQRNLERGDPYRYPEQQIPPGGRYPESRDYPGSAGRDSAAGIEGSDPYGALRSGTRLSSPSPADAESAYRKPYRHGEDTSRGASPRGGRTGLAERRSDGEDRYGRDQRDLYGRDRDDPYGRSRDDPYGRSRDDPYGRGRDDSDSRNANDRGRVGDDRYGRSHDDRYKDREGLHSRDRDREESPMRRRADVDDCNDNSSSRRDDPYSRREDPSQSRTRWDSHGSGRRDDTRDRGDGRRDTDARGDPYSTPFGQDTDSRSPRNRWNNKDSYGMPPHSRDQTFGGVPGDSDLRGVSSPARNSPVVRGPAPSTALAVAEVKKVEDLLCPPGRESRPPQLVVIIRGLPGSGKTYVSKLLREKEIKYGGSAPRMLCLDDYFMVEVDKQEVDPDTGKKVKRKVLEYEYEQALEDAYRQSLLKSFKKTVDDGFFPFIIVDATNEKVIHFSEFWSYAKSRGFQVYVGELVVEVPTCIQRNIHHWTEWDIEKVKGNWEPLPNHYIRLDLRWLLQDDSIDEVEMEDTDPVEEEEKEEEKEAEEEQDESGFGAIYKKSKWELDNSEKTLDKLDGIPVSKKHIAEHQSMKDYLQLDEPDQPDEDDEYFLRESLPGKKRVRWADLEEKKTQNRRRDLGFIVGQTQRDWERITDDDFASKQLNQTKYFYKN